LFQYNDRSGAIRRLLDAFEISFTGYATIVGMALIFYILSVGAIATLIAMNENLRSIRFELANRRMTADVAESNDETTNGTRIETPSRPLINRTPRVVTDSHDDLMLYFGMAGFVAFILVIAMWIA
jgi:hypothetical protein